MNSNDNLDDVSSLVLEVSHYVEEHIKSKKLQPREVELLFKRLGCVFINLEWSIARQFGTDDHLQLVKDSHQKMLEDAYIMKQLDLFTKEGEGN